MAEVSTLPAYVLANENLLFWVLDHGLSESFLQGERNILKEFVYVDFHRRNSTRPDHVFRHRWQSFEDDYWHQYRVKGMSHPLPKLPNGQCSIVLAALECLMAEYVEVRKGELHIRLDSFGWWQNMLSRISPMPLHAYALLRKKDELYDDGEGGQSDGKHSAYSHILYPYDDGVEYYISGHGINDSHVHINLCASAEDCWLNALRDPWREWKEQKTVFDKNSDVVELYREIHTDLTPLVMLKHMQLAARLRYLLKSYANDKKVVFRDFSQECPPVPQDNKGHNAEQNNAPHAPDSEMRHDEVPQEGRCVFTDVIDILHRMKDIPPRKWDNWDVDWEHGRPQYDGASHVYDAEPDMGKEQEWMVALLEKMTKDIDPLIDRALHLYLLLMNEFITFCVQPDNMYGFKQFQKFSYTEKSIVSMAFYYRRIFSQLHGPRTNSQVNYLEVRISPKSTVEDYVPRLGNILLGYLNYVKSHTPRLAASPETRDDDRQVYLSTDHFGKLLEELDYVLESRNTGIRLIRPAIVLHLIKEALEFSTGEETDGKSEIRYETQRLKYRRNLVALQETFRKYPKLKKWVRGIDAAAYEMDTPPDVFGPSYRFARKSLGIPHATYHTGEDFYHLVSGLRTIYEAVRFLGYQSGDRIGHGTAMGVAPDLWIKTMPRTVYPRRGEWLQDLIFCWVLFRECHEAQQLVEKLDYDIRDLGYTVFRKSHLSPYILKRVFDLRSLSPVTMYDLYHKARSNKKKYYQYTREPSPRSIIEEAKALIGTGKRTDEEQLVYEALQDESPEVLELILNWQVNKETMVYSEKRIEVPTDYLPERYLILLQQLTMKHLSEKGIIVETMPSSNLRIGQYKEMGQHHSLRWLGVNAYEGDVPPMVVLGSDDPGIFATDIKAEFYHIFASLCKRGLNRELALKKLVEINECGSRYAFRTLAHNKIE